VRTWITSVEGEHLGGGIDPSPDSEGGGEEGEEENREDRGSVDRAYSGRCH
jgi:hypothetical protein